ncbi:MAG: hypothetical protein RBT71_04935 [Flavobacteriales bacterium]|jgi:hypothetical protein|nr:hypothetical protein [Flavobacteriales bacterium]
MSKKWHSFPAAMGAVLVLGTVLLSGCGKEGAAVTPRAEQVVDPAERQRVMDMARKLPAFGVYNRPMDKVIVFRHDLDGTRSFNFVDPPQGGINFASSDGGQWTWSESQGLMVLTEPSGAFGGGGTVVAGNTALDIQYAVCFSFDEQALGADLFSTGINDVAGVVGIGGDFEALANGEFSEGDDLFDYFHGFAYYLVYAEQLANTDYEVLNWVEDLDQDPADLDGFGFAFVVSFQNDGGIYISRDGDLNVNGGSIGFNGNYYAIEGVGFFDEGDDDPGVTVVPGFGAMGC